MNRSVDRGIDAAKRLQARGYLEAAMRILNYWSLAKNELTSEQHAIVKHRQASLYALNKQAAQARAEFKAALAASSDKMTRARTERDFANFVLLNDSDTKEARSLINKALRGLDAEQAKTTLNKKKYRVEVAVTKGFLRRVDLVEGVRSDVAYAELRALDILLDESGDHVYQLANLSWIIDYTSDPGERTAYIKKAIRVAGEVGNADKQREYYALLLGGMPLRFAYTTSRSIVGLGVSGFKAAFRRLQ